MKENCISIIVPIYNAEKYLRQCIESIVQQTYKNWELILMNDGSTDHTVEICEKYAENNKDIHFYSHQNCGAGETRNRGLRLAKGEYITFIDADDYILPTYLEELYKVLHKAHAKDYAIALCGFQLLKDGIYRAREESLEIFKTNKEINMKEFIEATLLGNIFGCCWRILFPRKLVNEKVAFVTDIRIQEDQLFLFDVVAQCKKIYICDAKLYVYRRNHESVTESCYKMDFLTDKMRYLNELSYRLGKYDISLNEQELLWVIADITVKVGVMFYVSQAKYAYSKLASVLKCELWNISIPIQSNQKYKSIPRKMQKMIFSMEKCKAYYMALSILLIRKRLRRFGHKLNDAKILYSITEGKRHEKIAIVTLFDNNNFGNRIQNYAAQTYFQSMGFCVTTIIDKLQTSARRIHFDPIKIIKKIAHFVLQHLGFEKEKIKRRELLERRCLYINEFSVQHLSTTEPINYRHLPQEFAKQFDYFVTGSDQVWHCWKNDRRELGYFLLMFAAPSQRLTIAPSFGFDKFPKKYLDTYKKGLEGFEYLSVREERGAELIKELTGKDATVLLDPTMLIDTSEWLKILKKPSQYVNDKYIFVYALGGFKGEVKEKTCRLADDLGLQVIDIMDVDSDYYIHTRPDEFLYWIHNARLVVTDSFHASVFSILFNRPFVVTERSDIKGMGSRLDTLFNKFSITGRHFDELKDGFDRAGETRERLFAVDYSDVPEVLETERKKATEFYKKCFHEK